MTALNNLVRYLHLHVRGATATLEVEGGAAILDYQIHQLGAEANDQIGDGAVAVIFNIMRELCGPDWKPMEAWFAHRKPHYIEPFRRFFRVLLRFDAERHALVFSSSWLNRPLPKTHPDLRQLLQKQIDALEARHGEDFPEQVKAVLRAALVTGDVHAERVAALFSMRTRTLSRPPRRLRNPLPESGGRGSIRDGPSDVGEFGSGGARDGDGAPLRRRTVFHPCVPTLEWHNTGTVAGDSKRGYAGCRRIADSHDTPPLAYATAALRGGGTFQSPLAAD